MKSADAEAVRAATVSVFIERGFRLLDEASLPSVVEDEALLPDGDDWYGVAVSAAGSGWVSVYVADWPDSGVLARELSGRMNVPILELWVSDLRHWGYTYFEAGQVRDRFADDPQSVARSTADATFYKGDGEALRPILQGTVVQAEAALADARAAAGRLAAGPVDRFADALGLPFAHAFTGYEAFFEDDPEDYAEDLEGWPRFRHLAFDPPPGREGLTEG